MSLDVAQEEFNIDSETVTASQLSDHDPGERASMCFRLYTGGDCTCLPGAVRMRSYSAPRIVPGIIWLPLFFTNYNRPCKYKMAMTVAMVTVVREEGSKLQRG